MLEKLEAISVLRDIQERLNKNDIIKAKSDINIYIKNLKIIKNENIKELAKKHTETRNLYGEEGKETIKITKKIDKEFSKIFNEDEF